jgi:ATP-binding cassette, subfamily B, bacterial
MTMFGVQDEDRSHLTKEESRQVRQRSLRLLGSLLRPLRWRVVLTAAVAILTSAAQVVGPALIAYGVNEGLPAARDDDWMPIIMTATVFVAAGILGALSMAWFTVLTAKLSQGLLLDLRKRVYHQTQAHPVHRSEPLVPGALLAPVPPHAGRLGARHRAVRRDDARHPRGAGVPQGEAQRG